MDPTQPPAGSANFAVKKFTPHANRFVWVKYLGLAAGPLAALFIITTLSGKFTDIEGQPQILSGAGRATLAMMAWMSIWWFTEATDITATALLPIALFPVFGILDVGATCGPYADKVIFLFMGGFLLALSMQRWGLGQRIALYTLRLVGTRPSHMVAGFMLITAVFSAFVSNAATVAMMLPIATSIIALFRGCPPTAEVEDDPDGLPGSANVDQQNHRGFACCLLLAIAYSGSVGGMSTIIGTAPNAFAASFLRSQVAAEYRLDIGFAQWMLFGVPIAFSLLAAIWLLLTQIMFSLPAKMIEQGPRIIRDQISSLGPINRGEWITLLVFVSTVAAWLLRPALVKLSWQWHGHTVTPLDGLSDTGIVMIAALLLFVIPVERSLNTRVMNWQTAKQVPWNVLLLFGGGLSLAAAITANGVAEFLGSKMSFLSGQPHWLIIGLIVTFVVFLTELTSNTATTASLLPVLAALAPTLDIDPATLSLAVAISASCAFMLPVATPPNAIVFGSGEIRMSEMAKTGFWINLFSIACITLFTLFVVYPLLQAWRA